MVCLVPNHRAFRVLHHTGHLSGDVPALWLHGTWTRNVSWRHWYSAPLFLPRTPSENPFNYDLNDLGTWARTPSISDANITSLLRRPRPVLRHDQTRTPRNHNCESPSQRRPHSLAHSTFQQPNVEPSSFLYTSQNQPFAPHDRRTADELRKHTSEGTEYVAPGTVSLRDVEGLRHTMVQNWVEVQRLTRKSAK